MQEELTKFLESENAFWRWDNHKHVALLTSGKLSDFFANCTPVFSNITIQDLVAGALSPPFRDYEFNHPNIWVIGSAMGAIGLAQAIARCRLHKAAFTEQVMVKPFPESPHLTKSMQLKRFDLGKKPYVILCEDVITSGGTTDLTIQGILDKHPDARFHKEVLVMVNRNPGRTFDITRGLVDIDYDGNISEPEGISIKSIIEIKPNIWDTVDDLPDNMKDCIPIRPKDNWEKLATEKL